MARPVRRQCGILSICGLLVKGRGENLCEARHFSELPLPRWIAKGDGRLPDGGLGEIVAQHDAWIDAIHRRPPLLVSWDAGATWHESGGGLPPGFDVAVDSTAPDRVLYAARNRLYLSLDGARFWRSLAPELPDIEAVAWSTGA